MRWRVGSLNSSGAGLEMSCWGFVTVDLEISNICKTNCAICPRDAISRPLGIMSREVFYKCTEQLCKNSSRVTFSGMGDPLGHPNWQEFVEVFARFENRVGVQVNIASLDDDKLLELANAPISTIMLSFPSICPQSFRRILPEVKYEEMLERSEKLIGLCDKRIPIQIVGVQTREESLDTEEFRNFWKKRNARSMLLSCHSRGGNLLDQRFVDLKNIGIKKSCGLFARHAFITWEGDVLACCHDLTGSTKLGTLVDTKIPVLCQRKIEKLKFVPHFDLCKKCDEALRFLPIPDGDIPKGRKEITKYLKKLAMLSLRKNFPCS
jgi:hypothetical protein